MSRNHLCFRLGEALTIFSFSSVSCFSISRCPSWTVSVPLHGCGRSNRCEGKRISSGTNLPVFWLSPACHRWKTNDERLKRALMDSKSSLERFSESELRVWQPCQTSCVQDTRLYVPEIRSVVTQLPKRAARIPKPHLVHHCILITSISFRSWCCRALILPHPTLLRTT